MSDEHGRDQKILAVPATNPRYNSIHTVDQIYPQVRREIEHFFTIYKELEGKRTEIRGWQDLAAAQRVIHAARERYLKTHSGTPPGS